MRITYLALAFAVVALLGRSGLAEDKPAAKDDKNAKKINYEEHVRPIFRNRCFSCHNQDSAKGDLALDSYSAVMQGGASGEVVFAGDLDSSRLWALVNHDDSPKMPPEQDKLPEPELTTIKQWILGGALENAGSKAIIKKPAVNLAVSGGFRRPEGPVAMPEGLPKTGIHTEQVGAVTAIGASPWAPVVAVASTKQVLLYNTDTAELLGVIPFPEGTPYVIRFSRNGALLMVGGGRGGLLGKVAVYDVKTGNRLFEVGDELDAVLAADINESNTLIALGGPKRTVRVYSTADGSEVYEIKKHTDWVYGIEFSPDGVLLATSDRANGLFVWEAQTGREYLNLTGHTGPVTDVAWRADSNLLASCSQDGTVRLWEMNNGTSVKNWQAHPGGVQSIDFTHDGRIVTAGRDRTVKIWDANGSNLRTFEAFNDIALVATFSHDGKRVLGGDWSGQLRMWDADDKKRIADLSTNPPTPAMLVAQAQAAAAEAQKAAETAAAELAALKKQLEEKTAAVAKSQADMKATADALAKAKADQSAAQKASQEAAAALAKATEEAKAAKAAADKLAAEKAELEKLLAQKAKEAEAAQAKVAAVTQAVNQATAAKANSDKTLQAAEAAIKDAEPKLAAQKTAAEKLAAEVAELQKQLAEKDAAAKAAAAKAAEAKAASERAAAEAQKAAADASAAK
jgi:WD40 repeat protein